MQNEDRIHLHVYGIRNCDTVRAALKWLEARRVPFSFHDFRADGVSGDELRAWLATAHGPMLLNKRSASWRQLTDAQKQAAENDPDSVPSDNGVRSHNLSDCMEPEVTACLHLGSTRWASNETVYNKGGDVLERLRPSCIYESPMMMTYTSASSYQGASTDKFKEVMSFLVSKDAAEDLWSQKDPNGLVKLCNSNQEIKDILSQLEPTPIKE